MSNDWFGGNARNYIAAHVGIPDTKWAGRELTAPPPYSFTVVTASRASLILGALDGREGLHAVIGRSGGKGIADAIVCMRLEAHVELMRAHYEGVVLPRIQGGKE